jgi:hypothetical protein
MAERVTALREQLDRGLQSFAPTNDKPARRSSLVPVVLMSTIVVLVFLVLQKKETHVSDDPLFQPF